MNPKKQDGALFPSDVTEQPKRRGPQPSGISRADVYKAASKKHRVAQLVDHGLVTIQGYVKPETKKWLMQQKEKLGVRSVGEVIDALMQQCSEK